MIKLLLATLSVVILASCSNSTEATPVADSWVFDQIQEQPAQHEPAVSDDIPARVFLGVGIIVVDKRGTTEIVVSDLRPSPSGDVMLVDVHAKVLQGEWHFNAMYFYAELTDHRRVSSELYISDVPTSLGTGTLPVGRELRGEVGFRVPAGLAVLNIELVTTSKYQGVWNVG